ncbi:MAG: glycosyltransferase family 4 protein [candidate division WWE3 bacterium]|nr:glycosyltransferase family 4 protein [candidate division WWE3 bacterium]
MRILAIHAFFYPHRGGSERYLEELLARTVASHSDTEVHVLTYNTDHAAPSEIYRGLHITRIPCIQLIPGQFVIANPFFLIPALLKFSQLHFDFVISSVFFFDYAWWAWAYARLIKAKSLHFEHASGFTPHASKLVTIASKLIARTIGAWSLRHYDSVVAISAVNKAFVESLGVKVVAEIPNSVDAASFSAALGMGARVIPKIEITLPAGATVITFLGRLTWLKGVLNVYETAKEVLLSQKNVYFILAGSGDLESSLQAKIKVDGMGDHVFLTGDLNYAQVKQLFAISDIFVNPSWRDTLPTTVLEAGAAGLAVIASRVGAIPAIIVDGYSGLLVTPGSQTDLDQAVNWFLAHPAKRTEFGRNLRLHVQSNYDWEKSATSFYELLLKQR